MDSTLTTLLKNIIASIKESNVFNLSVRVCYSDSDDEHLKHAFENANKNEVRGTRGSRKDEQDAVQSGQSRAERVGL